MSERPSLRTRIEQARLVSGGTTTFIPEQERVIAVVTKLAKGHSLYEIHEACTYAPDDIKVVPLMSISEEQRVAFEHPETPGTPDIWPKVGSRAMQRLVEGTDMNIDGWIIVQPERYRYRASVSNGIDIRIVIHEYLACYVHWA